MFSDRAELLIVVLLAEGLRQDVGCEEPYSLAELDDWVLGYVTSDRG